MPNHVRFMVNMASHFSHISLGFDLPCFGILTNRDTFPLYGTRFGYVAISPKMEIKLSKLFKITANNPISYFLLNNKINTV